MMNRSSFRIEVVELRRPENVYTLQVKWFQKIKDIKDILFKLTEAPSSKQAIFHNSCPAPLSNQITLHDLGIDGDGHTLRLAINDTVSSIMLTPLKDILVDEECQELLYIVRKGLERKQVPIKTDAFDCTGGVYFMRTSTGGKAAVFKPFDEEQGMPNNYKGFQGHGEHALRANFKPGQGYLREYAAYVLDKDGFCGVPATTLVHCEHSCFNYPGKFGKNSKGDLYPKLGSLQKFVHSSCIFEDIGTGKLSDFEVQKIALLDLRLLNSDRNSSNILVAQKPRHRKNSENTDEGYENLAADDSYSNDVEEFTYGFEEDSLQLIPIDHGYCLPSKLLINDYDWSWLNYPQISRPVHPDIKEYMLSLDIDSVIAELTSQVIVATDCIFLLRLAHRLIVDGLRNDLTLANIASLVVRFDDDVPSPLEVAVAASEENALRTLMTRNDNLNSRATFAPRFPSSMPKPSKSKSSMFSNSPDLVSGSRVDIADAAARKPKLTLDMDTIQSYMGTSDEETTPAVTSAEASSTSSSSNDERGSAGSPADMDSDDRNSGLSSLEVSPLRIPSAPAAFIAPEKQETVSTTGPGLSRSLSREFISSSPSGSNNLPIQRGGSARNVNIFRSQFVRIRHPDGDSLSPKPLVESNTNGRRSQQLSPNTRRSMGGGGLRRMKSLSDVTKGSHSHSPVSINKVIKPTWSADKLERRSSTDDVDANQQAPRSKFNRVFGAGISTTSAAATTAEPSEPSTSKSDSESVALRRSSDLFIGSALSDSEAVGMKQVGSTGNLQTLFAPRAKRALDVVSTSATFPSPHSVFELRKKPGQSPGTSSLFGRTASTSYSPDSPVAAVPLMRTTSYAGFSNLSLISAGYALDLTADQVQRTNSTGPYSQSELSSRAVDRKVGDLEIDAKGGTDNIRLRLYRGPGSDRRIQLMNSAEFPQLRLRFAASLISKLIKKTNKSKLNMVT